MTHIGEQRGVATSTPPFDSNTIGIAERYDVPLFRAKTSTTLLLLVTSLILPPCKRGACPIPR